MKIVNSDVNSQVTHNVCLYHRHGYFQFWCHCKLHHVEEVFCDESCDIEINSVKVELKILSKTITNFRVMTEKILSFEKRLQDMGDTRVIYFVAVDELEHDVKILRLHMSRLSKAVQ